MDANRSHRHRQDNKIQNCTCTVRAYLAQPTSTTTGAAIPNTTDSLAPYQSATGPDLRVVQPAEQQQVADEIMIASHRHEFRQAVSSPAARPRLLQPACPPMAASDAKKGDKKHASPPSPSRADTRFDCDALVHHATIHYGSHMLVSTLTPHLFPVAEHEKAARRKPKSPN